MFKNPFSFDGRIRRTEFGLTTIIYIICYLFIRLGLLSEESPSPFIALALFVPVFWFVWAQGSKRCHDLGNSGWWQLIPFYSLWMLFQDGTTGPNQYGDDPKGRTYEYEDYDTAAAAFHQPVAPTPPALTQQNHEETPDQNNDTV